MDSADKTSPDVIAPEDKEHPELVLDDCNPLVPKNGYHHLYGNYYAIAPRECNERVGRLPFPPEYKGK